MAVNIANLAPGADPTYLAFLRSAGMEEGQARANVATQKSRIARNLANSQAPYQESLQESSRNIAGAAESNGLFNSGQRLMDQQSAATKINRQQLNYETGLRDNSADLDTGLAQQIAGLRAQGMEKALSAQQSLALMRAQMGIFQ